MPKFNKNLSIDSDSKEFDENVFTKESVNFVGLPFKESKSQLRQIHDIDIQTTEKPKFPPVILNSRITLHIQKGPVVKIPEKRKKFKSLNEEISYALSDTQQKQSKKSSKSSSKIKTSLFKKSMSKSKETLPKDLLPQTNESSTLDDHSNDSKLNQKQIKSNTLEKSVDLVKTCRICKLNKPNQFIQPCECLNDNLNVHCDCLAKLMEQSLEYDQCKICKSNYKLDRIRIIKKRKSIWSFFIYNRKNFAHLIELPFWLGFIFFLLALGVVQWEQSYKVIYVYWSAILIFLTILVVLNHMVFFILSLYDLKNKISRFRSTYFNVTIQINKN